MMRCIMLVLAVKWRRLGDTILWTSALEAIRELYPNSELDIAYPQPYQALFEADPRFARRFLLKKSRKKNLALVPHLRKRRYDCVLNFHASSRSLVLSLFAGGKQKLIHHHSRKAKRFFSDIPIVNLGVPQGANERDLNVVRTLGWKGQPPPTRIFLTPERVERAKEKLKALGWDGKLPLVAVAVDASRPAKRWPLENYLQLIEQLQGRAQVFMVYQEESIFSLSWQKRFKEKALLVPTPKLSSLMEAIGCAQGYVGSDSGAKHLACALGVPTVTLFGPESKAEWHFYDPDRHRVIQKPVDCRNQDPQPSEFSWCGETICPYASHPCMTQITPDEVFEQVSALLGLP